MGRVTALIIVGAALFGAAGIARGDEAAKPSPAVEGGKTLKERLSDKASDEQRVNDCNVPPEKRIDRTRPADCAPSEPGKLVRVPQAPGRDLR